MLPREEEGLRNLLHFIFVLMITILIGYFTIYYSTSIFFIIGIVVQVVGFFITAYLLLFDDRGTNSKVAWITVIIVLPVVGTISYLFFGRNPTKRKFTTAQYTERKKLVKAVQALPPVHKDDTPPVLSKRINHLTGIVPLRGNDIQILTNGDSTFKAILNGIKRATHHIHMQYYIFRTDQISTEIRDLLVEKAKEGVEVRFMYDDWGTRLPKKFLRPMVDAGVEIKSYDPIYSLWFARTANLRNHRKIVIVDGQVAFTGGLNVGEEYRSNTPQFDFWRDTHMEISGPVVRELQEAFLSDWLYTENKMGAADPFISPDHIATYFAPEVAGDDWAQVIYGGPYDKERYVRDAMLDLMDSAKESVWIISPYFVPDEESLAVIRRVSMSGIDVKVIIPGKGDRGISFHGSNAYVKTMMEAGAEMYAYDRTAFIHAKIMIVDGKCAAIGTANFDVRSFRLNHELMVFLYEGSDPVQHLVRDFKHDLKSSTIITETDIKNKSFGRRLKEQLSSLLSPVL